MHVSRHMLGRNQPIGSWRRPDRARTNLAQLSILSRSSQRPMATHSMFRNGEHFEVRTLTLTYQTLTINASAA